MIEAPSALRALAPTGIEAPTSAPQISGTPAAPVAPSIGGEDFASVLADVAASGMETIRAGEAAAIGGLQGKMSAQQVVEAVMSAEQTLQTAIAVRDKVVAAYQEISRMAI
jgi:flagellar hook-basal body complex protein FliE